MLQVQEVRSLASRPQAGGDRPPAAVMGTVQAEQGRIMSEANRAFKARNFEAAYEMYGAALRMDESNVGMATKLLCNRAIAALRLKRLDEAIQDASAALYYKEAYPKAYATRAAAYLQAKRYAETIEDYKKACRLEPSVPEHERQLRQAEADYAKLQAKTAAAPPPPATPVA